MYKERKLIMLADTGTYSELYMSKHDTLVFLVRANPIRLTHEGYTQRHLYVVSDEIPNVGEFGINLASNSLFKVKSKDDSQLNVEFLTGGNVANVISLESWSHAQPVKVIATTNRQLGHGDEYGGFYQLPDIPHEFIKIYCKNYNVGLPMTLVDVSYIIKGSPFFTPCSCDDKGKMTCMHFEMCEKQYDRLFVDNGCIDIKLFKEEKVYSKQEVEQLMRDALNFWRPSDDGYPGMKESWEKRCDEYIAEHL